MSGKATAAKASCVVLRQDHVLIISKIMETAVLSWIFGNSQVTQMARVIHEMSCYAHHMHETMGSPLHKYFLSHPMLKNHQAPDRYDRDQVHFFWLDDGQQAFQIMVCDGQDGRRPWLSLAPSGDFEGVNVQSGGKARYMVRIDRPLSRPQGKLSTKLLAEFVSKYDAVDAGV